MRRPAVALAVLLLPAAAYAGGALSYDTAGSAVGWDTASAVAYRTDLGMLGAKTNAQAVALIDQIFGQWQAVPTATIAYANAGPLASDVTSGNYGDYMGPYGGHTTPRGENAVVFDADGSIFDDLYGVGTGVIGFAGPTFFSDGVDPAVAVGQPIPPGSHIVEGFAFLNGKFIDNVSGPNNPEIDLQLFQAAILHELGHFSGLDHTQIHPLDGFERADGTRLGDAAQTETMYPFISRPEQSSPAMDDRVALSRLYPTSGFAGSTGCIVGRVLQSDGQPMSGANVVALSTQYPDESVSDVSGADQQPAHAGQYRLCGLVPGHPYVVEVQNIDVFASGGSRIGPFDPPVPLPGPPEAWNGPYEGSDPALDDPAQSQVINAPTGTLAGVDLELGVQRFRVLNLDWTPDGNASDAAPSALELADFDGDGKPDMVSVQQGFAPGNQLRFAHGRGDGTFDPPVLVDNFPGNLMLVAGQFNGGVDSFLDVAAASGSSKELRVYFGNGNGTFSAPTTLVAAVPGAQSVALAAGDLDGNGRQDLVYLRRESDDSVTVLAELASGSAFAQVSTLVPSSAGFHFSNAQALVVGQFVGSADADVVFMLGDQPSLASLVGDGAGGFFPQLQNLSAISARFGTALAAADFDGDGTLDLAVPDYAPAGVAVPFRSSFIDLLRRDEFSGIQLTSRYQVPEPLKASLVAADFDRDGHPDIASGGSFLAIGEPGASVNIAYGDGAGRVRALDGPVTSRLVTSIWGLAEFPAALYPGEMRAADLDGDGHMDLVVSDHSTDVFGVSYPPQISVLLGQDLPSQRATGFYTLPPCRLIDTRTGAALLDGSPRTLQLAGACGVPATATALSVNATAISPTGDGSLLFRAGPLGPVPTATSASFRAGVTRANNAIVMLSADGAGRVIVTATVASSGSVHLALDVNGYFQ